MSKKDFQNGFALGLASGGVLEIEKEEQEKTIDITENGTTEVLPDEGKALSKVTVNVEIESGGGGIDNPLQYATFRNGTQIFNGAVFPDNYHLDFKIKGNASSFHIQNFFAYCNAKEITVQVDTFPNGGYSVYYAFGGCSKLTNINFKNTPPITEFATCFIDCVQLETVNATFDLSKSKVNARAFEKCYKLKDIRFVENSIVVSIDFSSCLALSAESIQSVFDGLATVETAQTLTLHANAKILQSQVDSANAKGWTVAGGTIVSEEEYYA